MRTVCFKKFFSLSGVAMAVTASLSASQASADAVTDWNYYSILATKGATSLTTGVANAGATVDSNLSTRIEAIEARAVFDAINAIDHFSPTSYYYTPSSPQTGSASAAAAQAAHDVLLGSLPSGAAWTATRNWLDTQLSNYLTATLGVSLSDPGIAVGQAAAAAALAARAGDFSAPVTSFYPSTNIASTTTVNDTGNPGVGVWRPTNSAAGDIDPITGAPTGFVAGVIQPKPGIDYNWRNVKPFSLSTLKKQQLAAVVPPSLKVGSAEYINELAFVQSHGQDSAHPGSRSGDQTLQALYYKSDAELFVNEAARIASGLRGLTLDQNAKLFAALDNTLADARIAAFDSKYELQFWRPITALNADANGHVTSYTWKPLAATPSHPSNTAGHSTTGAAGAEILRAFFGDYIDPGHAPVTLTTLPWIIGTNNGTGQANPLVNGSDGTTRAVTTFTQLQLENGRSRLYLGVHFGNDDYQGQTLGVSVADAIIQAHTDPATAGVSIYTGGPGVASARHLNSLFVNNSSVSGFYGLDQDEGSH